jgi:hypothetical protein
MWVLGIVVIVGAILAALTLWGTSLVRRDEIVEGFARFPPGCAATIDVDVPGTYVVYAETSSELDTLRGNCNRDGDIDGEPGEGDDVALAFTDPDGDELEFDADLGDTYDVEGFVGRRIGTVTFTDPGDHVVTVGERSDRDLDVVVAIGRDLDEGAAALTAAAIATFLIGTAIGVALIVLGLRRSAGGPGPAAAAPAFGATPYVGPRDVSLTPVVPPPVSPPISLPPPPPAGPGRPGRPGW